MSTLGTIAITDYGWYSFLSRENRWDEVTFCPLGPLLLFGTGFLTVSVQAQDSTQRHRRFRLLRPLRSASRLASLGLLWRREWLQYA